MPKHTFSAVTVQIERLTSERFEENDLGGVVDLVEVIRIQASGPTEAARALRKKLKYGDVHRQIRALVILDALIQNAGSRFQRTFADEPLLERLLILARDELADAQVRQKVNVLFRQWATAYKGTPGLERIAALHKELPKTRRPYPQQSRVVRQQDAEAAREHEGQSSPPLSPQQPRRPEPYSPSSSSNRSMTHGRTTSASSSSIFRRDKKDKKSGGKAFNLEKDRGQLLETMASANVASTNLLNGLQLINRERERVSENAEVVRRFETCKQLRRQILRYIHLVESEQYIGGLLSANDELIKALTAFEIMDKSIDDDDSDSDQEASTWPTTESAMAGLSIEPAARPPTGMHMASAGKQAVDVDSESEADEDDPFSDRNAVRSQSSWRDV